MGSSRDPDNQWATGNTGGHRVDVSGREFQEIFDDVSTWGRWQDGQRGA